MLLPRRPGDTANITRHPQVKHGEIQLGENAGLVHWRIPAGGIGLDPNAISPANLCIAEGDWGSPWRTHGSKPTGGTFKLESVPGMGTRNQISLPKENING
jgi:hypothetical protein